MCPCDFERGFTFQRYIFINCKVRMNLKIHLHLQSQGTAIECFDLALVTCNIHAVVGYDVNAHFSGCNQKIRCCASRTQ